MPFNSRAPIPFNDSKAGILFSKFGGELLFAAVVSFFIFQSNSLIILCFDWRENRKFTPRCIVRHHSFRKDSLFTEPNPTQALKTTQKTTKRPQSSGAWDLLTLEPERSTSCQPLAVKHPHQNICEVTPTRKILLHQVKSHTSQRFHTDGHIYLSPLFPFSQHNFNLIVTGSVPRLPLLAKLVKDLSSVNVI